MGLFRVFLTNSSESLDVNLEATDILSLERLLRSTRFIPARHAESDEDGVQRRLLIPVSRIQLILEL